MFYSASSISFPWGKKKETNLPEDETFRALMGARSGFCKTRKPLLTPLLRHVMASLLINPPVRVLTWHAKANINKKHSVTPMK